jgi:glutathione synthase/RimK-type ligase-like ATP-grasp enzyme
MTRVVILTHAADMHALAVREALAVKGESASLWMAADFPDVSRETLSIIGGRVSFDSFPFDTVWYRRPASSGNEACRTFREGLFSVLRRDGFWVNDPEARNRAESKPLQHAIAEEAGLQTPRTLYTNDAAEVRRFIRDCGGRIVYKTLYAAAWSDGAKRWQPATSVITADDVSDGDTFVAAPAIYQELLPKAYELRVTVIGRRVFAARLDSQSTDRGRLDWRRAGDAIAAEAVTLPPEVEAGCLAVLSRLGLVFGCIDLVVTPDGRHVFLEVNQTGQWLFVERWTGMPLLDAFSELLLQGDPAFDWSPARVSVRYADVAARADAEREILSRDHVAARPREWRENLAAAEA